MSLQGTQLVGSGLSYELSSGLSQVFGQAL